MSKDLTAAEIRELLRDKFGVELEGRFYRLEFNFTYNSCYRKFYDDKPILPSAPPRAVYLLKIQEIGEEDVSEIEFAENKGMVNAFESFKLLNKYFLKCEIDGVAVAAFAPQSGARDKRQEKKHTIKSEKIRT